MEKFPIKYCGSYMNPAPNAVSHKKQIISHDDLTLFSWDSASPQRNHNPDFSLNS